MNSCPHCESAQIKRQKGLTQLGCQRYRCCDCGKQFNERTGSALNFVEYPTEVVMLAVHHYYRFKLSLDDVVELMQLRGVKLSHQTVHNWVMKYGVELGLKLRTQRKGQAGKKWHVDATYIRLKGHWYYLYRAIDKAGNLVDVYLSNTRDLAAAEAFFNQAQATTGVMPEQVTTDKEAALYPAVKGSFGESTTHRDSKYMNNRIERDHRGIKSRYRVMKGFKALFCAVIFCTVFEEIRQFFRMKDKTRGERRSLFAHRISDFNELWVISN